MVGEDVAGCVGRGARGRERDDDAAVGDGHRRIAGHLPSLDGPAPRPSRRCALEIREVGGSRPVGAGEGMVSAAPRLECASCGNSPRPEARFCTECGCALPTADVVAPAGPVSLPATEPNRASALPPIPPMPASEPSPWVASSELAAAAAAAERAERRSAHLYAAHGGAGATLLATVLGDVDRGRWAGVSPAGGAAVLIGRTHASGLDAVRQVLATSADAFTAVVLVPDAPGRLPRVLRDQVTIIGGVLPVVRVPWVEEWRTGLTGLRSSAITRFIDEYRKTVR